MKRPIVIYDACVLFPAPLRDTLLSVAVEGLCQARWTERIHEEWISNLLEHRKDLTREQLNRTRIMMNNAVPDSVITDYEELIKTLVLPDPNDRHVLAAAIHSKAKLILTQNSKDFPAAILNSNGLELCSPDTFLTRMFDENPLEVISALKKQRGRLINPPQDVDAFLSTLERQGLRRLVQQLQAYKELL